MFQFKELLKGYSVDKAGIQSVGNMTVIPIITDVEFTNVADANEIVFNKDRTYNQLEFKNTGGNIGIAFQGWAIMDEQKAQDRTLPYAHLIKGGTVKTLPANCIQAHQGGLFEPNKWNQENFMILPPSLRGVALQKSNFKSAETGALWETLSTWANGLDCRSEGLRYFYSKFENRLNQFVAQFEPVKKQVGAIVLLNGEIVAIDLMPKWDTWKRVWRTLIRDSYGAEAVRFNENYGSVSAVNAIIDMEKVRSFDDLDSAYLKAKDAFLNDLQAKVDAVVNQEATCKTLESVSELTMVELNNHSFKGQAVIHGDKHFVYVSLVKTGSTTKQMSKFKSLRRDPYQDSDFRF